MATPNAKRKGQQHKAPPAPLMSLRAFSRLLGVSDMAVRKAVTVGRLAKSIGRTPEGQPCISDVELAKQEWAANAAKAQRGKKTTLTEVQRRVGLQRERGLKIANDRKEGLTVTLAEVTREAFDSWRVLRERALNIVPRYAALLAAETNEAKVFEMLDRAIREALNDVADELKRTG